MKGNEEDFRFHFDSMQFISIISINFHSRGKLRPEHFKNRNEINKAFFFFQPIFIFDFRNQKYYFC